MFLSKLIFLCSLTTIVSESQTFHTRTVYSDCPPANVLNGCQCNTYSTGPDILINSDEEVLDSCMTSLITTGSNRFYGLQINHSPRVSLTENALKGVIFDAVFTYNSTIIQVHENFLGVSQNVTTIVRFVYDELVSGFPKIISSSLIELQVYQESANSQALSPILRRTFDGTPELEFLDIGLRDAQIMVHRHVFHSLKKLKVLEMEYADVHFPFGALHFSSPHLQTVSFGYQGGYMQFSADVGAMSGFKPGTELHIENNISGWHASKFFNVLSQGARIITYENRPHECNCDLAWIRYGPFLKQVDIWCRSGSSDSVALAEYSLDHCQLSKHQSSHTNEL